MILLQIVKDNDRLCVSLWNMIFSYFAVGIVATLIISTDGNKN